MLIVDVSFAKLFSVVNNDISILNQQNNFWSIAPSVVDIYLVMSAITWAQTTVPWDSQLLVKYKVISFNFFVNWLHSLCTLICHKILFQGHSVSNQPLVVRVTSQIWLKLISKVHQYVKWTHAKWKIPTQSRFEISARQSLGATPPLSVRNSRRWIICVFKCPFENL